jgi:hypothetical protein
MVHPSSRSTVKLSAVSTTCLAVDNLISIEKVVNPELVPRMCHRLIRALRTPAPSALLHVDMVLRDQVLKIQLMVTVWTPRVQNEKIRMKPRRHNTLIVL